MFPILFPFSVFTSGVSLFISLARAGPVAHDVFLTLHWGLSLCSIVCLLPFRYHGVGNRSGWSVVGDKSYTLRL